MPLCLTFFSRGFDDAVFRNHAQYCRRLGYPHAWVEADHIAGEALRNEYRYGQVLRHLRQLEADDWLLFVDDDSVFVRPVAVDPLLEGRQRLIVDGPSGGPFLSCPMTNMFVLRNTPESRAFVLDRMRAWSAVVALMADRYETAATNPEGLLECNAMVAGSYVNVSWRIVNWFASPVLFVVHLGPLWRQGRDGRPDDETMHDRNLQAFLVRRANAALIDGEALLQPASYPAAPDAAMTSTNPRARIALVTLYTHHVDNYARVSLANVRRYCERHGYAYHVYRGIPGELGPAMNGTWTKSWLLKRHLPDHDWVIWIDADMIFVNQSRPLDEFLEGRRFLFVKDVANWPVNAGLLGFRSTPENLDLLERIWRTIDSVDDKSGLYSSGGDQQYVNEVLQAEGLTGAEYVIDNTRINTPPPLVRGDTVLVHCMGLDEPYRSAYMADMDRRSLAAA
jgi:hypothetical protein